MEEEKICTRTHTDSVIHYYTCTCIPRVLAIAGIAGGSPTFYRPCYPTYMLADSNTKLSGEMLLDHQFS